MIFCIVVHGHPVSSQAARSALRFAQASVESAHQVGLVFFYHDAVELARRSTDPEGETETVLGGWRRFADASGAELAVCISAAARRKLVGTGGSASKPEEAVDPAFTVAGLGQLAEAIIQADRVVTFAA